MSDTPRRPQRMIPLAGVTNGEHMELAYVTEDGELHFAAEDGFLVGPGSIDPQDARRLLEERAPVMSVSYDGIVDGEYDPTLEGKDGMAIYHEMLSDGTVENAINYLYGQMQSVDWKIEPATDDEQDIQIAAWVADQLGIGDVGGGKYPFGKLLTIYMTALVYGRSHGEIVLAPGADDRIVLDKIIPIHPFNVDEIKFDDKGGPKELVISGEVRGNVSVVSNKKIPIWKTITFLHRDDGSFNGRSFLRAAVAHWRVKRALIVMINQSVERFLIGVPMVKVPPAVRTDSVGWQQARKIVTDFVLRPRTGIVLPPNWEFEVVKLSTDMPDAKPYLEYHDAALARAMGMDWNTIASGEGMRYTAVGQLESITRNTVRRLLNEFATTVNFYLIPKLVLLNWPTVRRYPRIRYDMDTREDFSASANLMGMIINAALAQSNARANAAITLKQAKINLEAQSIKARQSSSNYAHTDEELENLQLFADLDLSEEENELEGSSHEVPEMMRQILSALPPRFKRALGYDEVELQERMAQYRKSAHSLYPIDNRKIQPPVPRVNEAPDPFSR